MLIEGLEVGPRCMVRIECSRPAEESYLRSSSDGSVAPSLMLLLGISACTAAEPRSAATPTVPRTSATGMTAGPRSSGTVVVPPPGSKKSAVVPRPDHVVVVILENEQRSSVIGSAQAPYLTELAARGGNLTHSYGVTHPSQPNYLALFSGSTQGVTSNACPQRFPKADNLGHQLRAAGFSFAG